VDARTGSKRFLMAGTIGTTSARRAATTGGSRRTATLLKPRFVMQFWLSGCQAQAVAAAVMVVRGSYVEVTTVVPTNSAEARLRQLNRCNSIVKRRGGLARAPMPDKVTIFVVGIMWTDSELEGPVGTMGALVIDIGVVGKLLEDSIDANIDAIAEDIDSITEDIVDELTTEAIEELDDIDDEVEAIVSFEDGLAVDMLVIEVLTIDVLIMEVLGVLIMEVRMVEVLVVELLMIEVPVIEVLLTGGLLLASVEAVPCAMSLVLWGEPAIDVIEPKIAGELETKAAPLVFMMTVRVIVLEESSTSGVALPGSLRGVCRLETLLPPAGPPVICWVA
jgi:hypothetical protein